MADEAPSRGPDETPRLTRRQRALLFVALLALGVGIGLIGQRLTGNDAWFLAIPALLAVAWLFVGTPEQCGCPPGGERR